MSWSVSLGEITFPIAPSKMTVVQKSRNRTVNLLDGTQRVISRAPALTEWRLELLLPRHDYPFAHYQNGFTAPEVYLEQLRAYAEKGTCVSLSIRRAARSEEHGVYVGDVAVSEDAEGGEDVTLTLTLIAGEKAEESTTPETYTVREGDTLRLIARRVWGDASLWNYLYGFNVNAIEAAAKAEGYADSRFGEHLAVGLCLTIPQEVSQNGGRG